MPVALAYEPAACRATSRDPTGQIMPRTIAPRKPNDMIAASTVRRIDSSIYASYSEFDTGSVDFGGEHRPRTSARGGGGSPKQFDLRRDNQELPSEKHAAAQYFQRESAALCRYKTLKSTPSRSVFRSRKCEKLCASIVYWLEIPASLERIGLLLQRRLSIRRASDLYTEPSFHAFTLAAAHRMMLPSNNFSPSTSTSPHHRL